MSAELLFCPLIASRYRYPQLSLQTAVVSNPPLINSTRLQHSEGALLRHGGGDQGSSRASGYALESCVVVGRPLGLQDSSRPCCRLLSQLGIQLRFPLVVGGVISGILVKGVRKERGQDYLEPGSSKGRTLEYADER